MNALLKYVAKTVIERGNANLHAIPAGDQLAARYRGKGWLIGKLARDALSSCRSGNYRGAISSITTILAAINSKEYR
jgi:hypothetical protein